MLFIHLKGVSDCGTCDKMLHEYLLNHITLHFKRGDGLVDKIAGILTQLDVTKQCVIIHVLSSYQEISCKTT